MHISSLTVSNFRAIKHVQLANLSSTVVIAGPNGCGKSCLFDAIRLLKSAYGGYSPQEVQQWFNEFHIEVGHRPDSWLPLFQDHNKPMELSATFVLSDGELTYIRDHLQEIVREHVWAEIDPQDIDRLSRRSAPLAASERVHRPEVDKRVGEQIERLSADLNLHEHLASVVVDPTHGASLQTSLLLEIVFSRYDPRNIGVIDYHGAYRSYGREAIGGISLSLAATTERMKNSALYNYTNKYSNLKAELAAGYLRTLVAMQAGDGNANRRSLDETLKELFTTFFPGKEFLGPQPTSEGTLLFEVRTPNGAQHDIDELSAGEKEVLYGYLRLRNTSPKNSVLLIDEPELHLNPRLVSGLASFYHNHLGSPLGTQLWLVTHSDTLIREAVGQDGFSVFHMQPAGHGADGGQATPVRAQEDIERVVISLVGDLAAYRPGSKIVVFEGDSESAFDVGMTCKLFPRFQASTNQISGGNKQRVSQLYELLETARGEGHLPGTFYSITDADNELEAATSRTRRYSWDVYHIENYLLEPLFILRVLADLNLCADDLSSEEGVERVLRRCAEETINDLVAFSLRASVNRQLVASLELGFDPARSDVAVALVEAVQRASNRIDSLINDTLAPAALSEQESQVRRRLNEDIRTDRWKKSFRGRDVLRRFVGALQGRIAYEPFRNLIVSKMRDAKYEPPGMKTIVDSILCDVS